MALQIQDMNNLYSPEDFYNYSGDAVAAAHYMGHMADPNRFGVPGAFTYHWVNKEQPTPGALSYAFESLALPEFSPIGPGVHPKNLTLRNATQQPQSYIPNQAVPIAGYGGVLAGTVIMQPLYDPASNSFGGVELGQ